jgi:hypothetical protein
MVAVDMENFDVFQNGGLKLNVVQKYEFGLNDTHALGIEAVSFFEAFCRKKDKADSPTRREMPH